MNTLRQHSENQYPRIEAMSTLPGFDLARDTAGELNYIVPDNCYVVSASTEIAGSNSRPTVNVMVTDEVNIQQHGPGRRAQVGAIASLESMVATSYGEAVISLLVPNGLKDPKASTTHLSGHHAVLTSPVRRHEADQPQVVRLTSFPDASKLEGQVDRNRYPQVSTVRVVRHEDMPQFFDGLARVAGFGDEERLKYVEDQTARVDTLGRVKIVKDIEGLRYTVADLNAKLAELTLASATKRSKVARAFMSLFSWMV